MTNQINKYTHQEMDKFAGIEHTTHRTKIVATVGPACDSYDKLLELVKAGANLVVAANEKKIIGGFKKNLGTKVSAKALYGKGDAAIKIAKRLSKL